jgi:hypothetical protein
MAVAKSEILNANDAKGAKNAIILLLKPPRFKPLALFAPFVLILWSCILHFKRLCYCHVKEF